MIKWVGFLFLSAILLSLTFLRPLPVSASENAGQEAAEYLYELGLFRGTGFNSDGTPVFELDRSPTRAEAIAMLIRLLGLEEEALNSTYSHPFTDTQKWSEPYIACAYNKGFTNGVSPTRFGSSEKATVSMYVTFVLRSLGYTDSGDSPDFRYSGSVSFAMELGLIDSSFSGDRSFIRSDIAIISKTALSLPLRDSDQTLYQRLVADGVIVNDPYTDDENEPLQDDENAPYWNDDKTALSVTTEYGIDNGYIVSRQTLLRFFPEMVKVLYPSRTEDIFVDPFGVLLSDRYNPAELVFIDALSYEKHYERYGWTNSDIVRLPYGKTLYLVDNSYNILAICTVPEKESLDEVTFHTRVEIDGARLNADYHRVVDTVARNWEQNVFELGEERFNPWNDGPRDAYIRFVKMNGSYVSDGWYCSVLEFNPAIEIIPVEEAEKTMTRVFFFSDNSLRQEDPDGNVTYSNYYFTEGVLYMSVDDPNAPASRGFWFTEHNNWPRLIYFFTRDGVYLGQIFVPAG